MSMSESIGELAAALAKAQGQMRGAEKDRENPGFKFKYATLASMWDACRGPLSANGLAVSQITVRGDDGLTLVTMLMHSSGQWIASEYPVNPVRNDPQGWGSAMTYARRYSLSAIIGQQADDDDDGDRASTPKGASKPATHHDNGPDWDDIENLPQAGQKPTNGTTNDGPKMATDKQVGMMGALVKEMYPKAEDMESFRAWLKQSYNVTSRKELTLKQASEVIEMLQKMKNGEQVPA